MSVACLIDDTELFKCVASLCAHHSKLLTTRPRSGGSSGAITTAVCSIGTWKGTRLCDRHRRSPRALLATRCSATAIASRFSRSCAVITSPAFITPAMISTCSPCCSSSVAPVLIFVISYVTSTRTRGQTLAHTHTYTHTHRLCPQRAEMLPSLVATLLYDPHAHSAVVAQAAVKAVSQPIWPIEWRARVRPSRPPLVTPHAAGVGRADA